MVMASAFHTRRAIKKRRDSECIIEQEMKKKTEKRRAP